MYNLPVLIMRSSDKQLALRIAALKEAIRRKYRMFKDGVTETEKVLEKQNKPIIKELQKSAQSSIKPEPESFKEEKMDYDTTDESDDDTREQFEPPTVSTPKAESSQLQDIVSTPSGLETVSRYVEENFENPLTRKFMKLLMEDVGGKSRIIDHDYGPRYDNDGNTLMVGNQKLDFDIDGSILLNKTKYKPTEGLYELLFKRLPDDDKYTEDDLQTYKNILISTNAHKKGYNFHNQIKRDISLKYKYVIKNLFPVKAGKGMTWKSAKSRDLVHWDDPNELVTRLKLLVMSADTGNTSHSNEIINIIEELRQAGYIKGAGNSRFKSLL